MTFWAWFKHSTSASLPCLAKSSFFILYSIYYMYIYIVYVPTTWKNKTKCSHPESWPRNWGQCPQHSVAAPFEGAERGSAAVGRIVTGAPWYHNRTTPRCTTVSARQPQKFWSDILTVEAKALIMIRSVNAFAFAPHLSLVKGTKGGIFGWKFWENCAKYPCLKSMEVENVHSWSLFNLCFLLLSLVFFLNHSDRMEIKLQGAPDK